jgi:hypothetical protein
VTPGLTTGPSPTPAIDGSTSPASFAMPETPSAAKETNLAATVASSAPATDSSSMPPPAAPTAQGANSTEDFVPDPESFPDGSEFCA